MEAAAPSWIDRPGRRRLEAARAVLPAYALPSAVVKPDLPPTTARGKLDARLPPPPPRAKAGLRALQLHRRNASERVWQELLGYDDAPLDAQADFVISAATVCWRAARRRNCVSR